MCGRISYHYAPSDLIDALRRSNLDLAEPTLFEPRYNVAPTQLVPIIRRGGAGELTCDMLRWGLVPFWAEDPKIGNRLINARCEDAHAKPSFRAAFRSHRCLVPVSSFFEWQTLASSGSKKPTKQPWLFRVKEVPVFMLAGLWERWKPKNDPGAAPLETFTILTRSANEHVAAIHDRMPVIVSEDACAAWLDANRTKRKELERAMSMFPADRMQSFPVSKRVNTPANDDAGVIEPSR